MDSLPVQHGAPGCIDPERFPPRFPVLAAEVNGRPLACPDDVASTQKPRAVIDRPCRLHAHASAKNDEEHALRHAATAGMLMKHPGVPGAMRASLSIPKHAGRLPGGGGGADPARAGRVTGGPCR